MCVFINEYRIKANRSYLAYAEFAHPDRDEISTGRGELIQKCHYSGDISKLLRACFD